jgi:hypothetical protein
MLFRVPKLIKVEVTKTRRNRDGHFTGKSGSYVSNHERLLKPGL